MILANNPALLTVEEFSHISGIYYVAYDGRQVSQFASKFEAEDWHAALLSNLKKVAISLRHEYRYTQSMDLNEEIHWFEIHVVGDQGHVFAYDNQHQVSDIFQYNVYDFYIDEAELNADCENIMEALQYCMEKYTNWQNPAIRSKSKRRYI